MKLGASAAPDGQDTRALLLAWEETAPLLAYSLEDPEWQAMLLLP